MPPHSQNAIAEGQHREAGWSIALTESGLELIAHPTSGFHQ
jgi:hypothetical protein